MFPHPPAGYLLAGRADTPAGRAAARAELRQLIVRRAEQFADFAARSANCQIRMHLYGRDHQPCGNDGSTCICECHDNPKETKR